MNIHIPRRLPSPRDFSHDARQLIIVTGLISASYFGAFALLRGLFLLRLGYDPAYLGTYYAAGALTFMLMGVPSGALGQRFGTRATMLAGGCLTVGGMFLLPVAARIPDAMRDLWPPLTQIITVAGWSMFSVNSVPALMLVTTDENRSAAYALTGVLRGIGSFTGTLIGGVLPGLVAWLLARHKASPIDPRSASPYAWGLFISAISGLATIIPLVRIRGGLRPTHTDTQPVDRGPFPAALVIALIVYVFLRHMGWTTSQAYSGPYMDTDLHLSTPTIGLLTSIGQIAAIGATLLLPRMTKRWSHGRIVALSTTIQIVSLALMASFRHWSAAGLGLLGIQVSAGIWLPELQIFQMELVDEGWRGLAYGAVAMAMGLGFGSMSIFGGRLITARGYSELFMVGAAFSIVASGLMMLISRQTGRKE
ncbi:MAG: MFS transporter [Anaerolineae bacterium]|nr:MFS transporter [Anaerolineae bacterium]